MSLTKNIIPISYLKTNLAEMISNIDTEPYIITQNGSAKAVLLSAAEYENLRETLALLKILALGEKQIEEGKTCPVDEVFGKAKQRALASLQK